MTLKYIPKYQEAKHPCPDFLKSSFGAAIVSEERMFGCAYRTECKNYDKVKCVLTEKLSEAK